MGKWYVFLCFWHKIQFKTTNHCGHCCLADIKWSISPTPNSDTLSLLPLHMENLPVSKYKDMRWDIIEISFFSIKKHSTKSQIVPAVEFSSLTFTHQIYLLMLIWEHHITINCQWDYHTTKQVKMIQYTTIKW